MIDWQEYLTYGQWIELKQFIKTEDNEEIITMKLLSVIYDIEIEEIEEMKVSEVNRLLEVSVENTLKKTGQSKNDRTHKILGYTVEQLKNHVYNHSNWGKVKDGDWHLDHFHPIQAFLDYNIKDLKLINCLENLQPLTSIDNLKKGSKYDKKEFEEWLIGKGYEIVSQ